MDATAIPLDKLGIPPEFARYVDASSPREVKLLAARGFIPAPPRVLISIQYCLLADPDGEVATAGREGLLGHPGKVLEGALDDRTHPKILEFYAFHRSHDDALMEFLLLRRQINDRSICFLAERLPPKQLEMVAGNQERLLITPIIFEHIKRNPNATKAMLDRLESFLRMYNALDGLLGEDAGSLAAEPSQPELGQAPAPVAGFQDDPGFEFGFEDEEEEFPEDWLSERKEGGEEDGNQDLWSKISKLPIGKKIKLAYFGNATVRALLVRDTNKMVASAVMKSPRLTEPEVLSVARNRNVCDEVLRQISRNKEWMKLYAIKVALVSNPKCPATLTIPIINSLMMQDLKSLANNRNVSSVVTQTAKQALRKKSPN